MRTSSVTVKESPCAGGSACQRLGRSAGLMQAAPGIRRRRKGTRSAGSRQAEGDALAHSMTGRWPHGRAAKKELTKLGCSRWRPF